MVKVHYFFDPMCGWCYGATSLIQVLAESSKFDLVYHPGGMIPKRAIDPSYRQQISRADAQIAEQTQAVFGDTYKARVASSEAFVLDSYITTQAFNAGKNMGVEPHLMLKSIQEAHYIKGKSLDQLETLEGLAITLGLDPTEWNRNMDESEKEIINNIKKSHALMEQLDVSGYPTLVAETDGDYKLLPISAHYGNVGTWKEFLRSLA